MANFIPVDLDSRKSVFCSARTYSKLYNDGRGSDMVIFYADDELPSLIKLKYKEEIKLVEITDEMADAVRNDRYVYFSNKNSTLFKKLQEVQILSNRRTMR
jgi:hypothetical protein